jgi:hypothetical protein
MTSERWHWPVRKRLLRKKVFSMWPDSCVTCVYCYLLTCVYWRTAGVWCEQQFPGECQQTVRDFVPLADIYTLPAIASRVPGGEGVWETLPVVCVQSETKVCILLVWNFFFFLLLSNSCHTCQEKLGNNGGQINRISILLLLRRICPCQMANTSSLSPWL